MKIPHLIFGLFLIIIGIIAIIKNRFYKDKERNSFVFMAKVKLFGSGIIAVGVGIAVVIEEISKL